MTDDRTPILIGAGQVTLKKISTDKPETPLDIIVEASRRAAKDTGLNDKLFAEVDTIACPSSISPRCNNLPKALAQRLQADPSSLIYTHIGGNTPQWLVACYAEKIANNEADMVLLASGELLKTAKSSGGGLAGLRDSFNAPPGDHMEPPETIGDPRFGTNDREMAHGLMMPVNVYPLFENALRVHYGESIAQHQQSVGDLYADFSQVAADNPYAWFQTPQTAEEIITPTDKNRYIGFPYTKYMNSIIAVNQSAAVILTSVGTAKRLGIDESRWVYIHGVGDTHDHWWPTERNDFHSSPGIRVAGREALDMAGLTIEDIDYLDLYSCFPSAVQIARDELGIDKNDPRHLTVTGGLRYCGGPGNNYPMHSIATVMDLVRTNPGKYGLVTGLGWHITKHSVGIYGTEPTKAPWKRKDPAMYQSEIDVMPAPTFAEKPAGNGTVETYTVLYSAGGIPEKGVVIGRLEDGQRFIANTPNDREGLEIMTKVEIIGKTGHVSALNDAVNLFEFD